MPDEAYLRVENLCKRFGSGGDAVDALDHVSFTLGRERFLSILGPSGCGKSTLFNIISGLMAPDQGDAALAGASLIGRPGMTGYMLQRDLLLPWYSVADNITLAHTLRGQRKKHALQAALSDARACGLNGLLKRRPDELSGGQKQRAALVRTLQTGKELLLLDEPFGALDEITRLHLQQLLTDVCMQKHMTVLFVTHNVDEALMLSDEIIVMGCAPGRIIAQFPLPQEKPRTMVTLASPDMMRIKAEIMALLEQEVKHHDQEA